MNCGAAGCHGNHSLSEPGIGDYQAYYRRANNGLACGSPAPASSAPPAPRRLRPLAHGDRYDDYAEHDAGGFAVDQSEPHHEGAEDWDWEG